MKKQIIYIVLLCLVTIGCKPKPQTKVDSKLQQFFFQKVDEFENYTPSQAQDEEFIILSGFFIELTNHPPTCEIKTMSCYFNSPDTVIYSIEDYKQDKAIWNKWFDNHKTQLNYHYTDSIYKAVKQIVTKRKDREIKEAIVVKEIESSDIDPKLLPDAYGIDDLGNALFAIDEKTFYYPDSDMRCDYVLKGDTLQLIQEGNPIESMLIKELTQEHLIIYSINYQTIDTLVRRGPHTGDDVAEEIQLQILFEQFLLKFNTDSLFQLKHVQFPFATKSIDIEDKVEISHTQVEQWRHLDLSYDSECAKREVDAYEQVIEVFSDSSIVSIKGIDNGIWMDYIFERKEDEWILTKFIDYSN